MSLVVGHGLTILRYSVSLLLTFWCIGMLILNLPSVLGGYLPIPQKLAVALILALILFSLTPRRGAEGKTRWYDIIPLVLAMPALIVSGFFYDQIEVYEAQASLDTTGVMLAIPFAIALLYAAWRCLSPVFTVILTIVLLMVRFQPYLPGMLHGRGYELDRLGYAIYVGSEGIYGIPFYIACTILVMFLIFGQLFQQAGGGEWFLKFATLLLAKSRGGAAKSAVIASFLFGMISGSPSANTATTGAITIPLMKKVGYNPNLAGAIEATASTGGNIMPPVMGSIAFIMSEWLSIPYYDLVLMAAVPAVLYFVIVFAGIHFEAVKMDRPLLSDQSRSPEPLGKLLLSGWIYILPIAVLMTLLLVFRLNPDLSGIATVLTLIVTSYFNKDKNRRLSLKKIVRGMYASSERWLTIAIVTSAVGMMVGSLALSGLGVRFSSFILDITGGNLVLILMSVAAGCFLLGFGLDSIPMYITMVILTAPALLKVGVPAVAAHLFVLYWGMTSFITPPVCIAIYVACAISGGDIWRTGGNAIRLGVGFYIIPFAFVFSPALLLMGSVPEIALAAITALIGGVSMASGLWGFGLTQLNWILRALQIIGGFFVILRDWRFEVLGFVFLGLSLLFQLAAKKKAALLIHRV